MALEEFLFCVFVKRQRYYLCVTGHAFQNWQEIILIDMHFIYFVFLFFQLSNIQTTVSSPKVNKMQHSAAIPKDLNFFFFFAQCETDNFISFEAAQTDQTEPLDLSISKVREVGSKSQGLSVEGVSDERIKPTQQLVPIETLMEVVELSKQRECLRKKRLCNVCQKEI
ncbi:unnamed protein product, partial [Brugia timori]|uniref:Ovule protein n=1 Tax=Brugia timori TaxID=42155 RepID=A0A0R3QHG1_9BILA